jgi:DNA-binding LytR/AlgR family response regulator
MKIRCLIIDDEPLAQRVIERYVQDLPFLEITGKAANAMDALEVLKSGEIDLIFLDINMPKLSGIEFLRTLQHSPLVIITTAYAEYALQGYELNVMDYLMKPFSFERFVKAIQKVRDILEGKESTAGEISHQKSTQGDYIFIKSSKKTYRVNFTDILYVEALGDYIKIFTTDRMIVSYHSMKNIEKILPPERFPRIHKSYIVSMAKVEVIEGNQLKIRDKWIPIGTNYKADFEKLIKTI